MEYARVGTSPGERFLGPRLEAYDGDIVGLIHIAHPLNEFLIEEQALVVGRQLMYVKQQVLKAPYLELLMLGTSELVAIAVGEHIEHIAGLAFNGGTLERLDLLLVAKDANTDRETVATIYEHLIVANKVEVVHCAGKVNLLLLMVDHAYRDVHTIVHLNRADFGDGTTKLTLELGKDLTCIVDILTLDDVADMVDTQD